MKSTNPRPEFRSSRTSAAVLLALFTLVSPLSPLFAAAAQAQGGARRPVAGDSRAGQPADKGSQPGGGDVTKSPKLDAPINASAVTIKATMDDGVAVGQSKRPGETITYTVTVRNTGSDPASAVKFVNDLSANLNLTLVNGSAQTQPLAIADAFNVLGNVRIQVPDGASDLLANDFDPDTGGSSGLTVTAETKSSAQCAGCNNVTINADGSFSYNPPAGYDGTDTFTYTVTDATGKTDTATATLTITGMIWFVQTGATACTSRAAGCGRLTNPFSDLQSFQAAQGGAGTLNGDTVDPEANDNIFLYTGNANYTAPLTLLSGQKLIGQGATDTLQAISGVTVPAHSDALPQTNEPATNNLTPPTITSAAGGILLNANNTLRGFNVGAVGSAQAKIQGTSFGTLTIGKAAAGERDINFSGAGRILSLTTGAFDATSGINSAVSTGSSGGAALALSGVTGTLSFAGVTIAGGAAEGISVTGNSSAAINFGGVSVADGTVGINANGSTGPLTFGNTSVTSSSVTGVQLVNNTGALSFGDLDIATDSGATGLGANGNNSIAATSGTIGTTNGPAVHVTNSTINLTFDSVSADNDAPFNANGVHLTTTNGTLSVAAGTLLGGTAPAFLVSGGGVSATYAGGITQAQNNVNASLVTVNGGHQTGTLTFQTGTLSATNGTGLQFDNADGIYVFNGPVSLNGGDAGVDILNGSAGMFGFANATVANASAGPAFNVANSNPTVNYTGTVSQSNAQRVVQIDNTTGNTVAFNGAVTATNSSTGVLIQNANGGSVTFSALNLGTAGTRLTSNGVTITKGTGSGLGTFALGTVNIFTNNASSIVATDIDGTVNATGNVNSTNGAAINVDGPVGLTTLGMTFTSVNANGSTHGIRVRDTNGNFTVNGTGTTVGSGGTIQNTDARGAEFISATNVTLKNMNFTNANDATDGGGAGACDLTTLTNCNSAIYMNGVTTVATLDNLDLTGTMVENGITAVGVQNFKFDNSSIVGGGNEANEHCIAGQNWTGTATVNNTTLDNGFAIGLYLLNRDAGVNLTVNNSTISDNGDGNFLFESQSLNAGQPTSTLNITSSTLVRHATQAVQIVGADDSIVNVDITGCTIDADPASVPGNLLAGTGIDINADDTSQVNFNILNNPTIESRGGSAVNLTSFLDGNLEGRVNNNPDIEVLSGPGIPVRMVAEGTSNQIIEINGNTVSNVNGTEDTAIDAQARFGTGAGTGRIDATITNNTVLPEATGVAGINLISGNSTAGEATVVCGDVSGNNVTTAAAGATRGFRIRVSDLSNTNRLFLEGFIEGGNALQDTEATWNGRSNLPTSVGGSEVAASLTGTAVGPSAPPGGTCAAVDTSADFTVAPGPTGVGAEAQQAQAQTPAPLTIPGLMITRAGAQPQAARPAPQQVTQQQPAPQPAAVQPKAQNAKSADAAQGSKAGSEKSKKTEGQKVGGVHAQAGVLEVNIGTLPGNDEVTITFQATISETLSPASANSVSNQGTVSGTNFSNVVTDDPQTTPPAAGDGNDATVTPIDKFEPTIVLASSDTTTDAGQSVTFTATLGLGTAPGVPAPTGTVSFVDQTDAVPANWEVLCSNVAITGATAQCVTTAVDAGTRTIAAVYSGDGRYDPATDTETQTVTACQPALTVTSTADDGSAGTLRHAITNACAGATITFDIAGSGPHAIALNPSNGELAIAKNLTITGPLAESVAVTGGTVRAFHITAGTVNISNLTVRDSDPTGTSGGGLFAENAGTVVTLTGMTFSGNSAQGGTGGAIAVANDATLNVVNTTISGNTANAGGGIENSLAVLNLINVTMTNNDANLGNVATPGAGEGGGVLINSGFTNVRNSIVTGNLGTTGEENFSGTPTDQGNNLIGVDAGLDPTLASNGGPTQTHKLLAGSNALDGGNNCVLTVGGCAAGDPAVAVTTDQRGFTRPADAGIDSDTADEVDIGAVEMQASVQTFADATITQDTSHTVTDFSVGDGDRTLTVTAASDNQTLVPNANAVVTAGSSADKRTLTVTPAAGLTGTANITVTVTDTASGDSMSDTFLLTVNAATPKADPVVTITADNPDPSLVGQAVTVTYTVTGSAGTPTGNVTVTASGGAETCTATVAVGQCDITLTAAGNRTLTATYAGDAAYNGGADTEAHAVIPSVTISDATATEASQLATFTVHLSSVSTETVTVDFTTADGGANPATAGSDYTTTSGQVVFMPGQTLKTISVPVNGSDAAGESDETFLVNLTGATNGNVSAPPADNQAVGTITENNPAGAILISEIRTSGPGGAGDQFVEIYNNSDSAVTVQATDISAGWALVASNNGCAGDPVVVGVIPNGEVIPARGHYLFAGSAYSLTSSAALNLTLAADLSADANVALFTSSSPASFSSTTRLDAVGFFDGVNGLGGNCDLLREGTPLNAAQGSTSQYSFFRKLTSGKPQDTGRSVDDFQLVSTTPSVNVGFNATTALGAPGPENIASPIQRNDKIKASLIDPMQESGAGPNSVRKFCSPMTPGVEECDANRSQNGTFSIRRRWTNNTGDNVTQLRFRLVNVTVGPAPAGTADLRAISSLQVTGVPLTGGGTVDVEGTTLDAPTQPFGGGFNSTLSAGTITVGTPLAPGASVNLQFLLGVQQPGAYTFFVNVEAGPAPAGTLSTANRESARPAKEGVNKDGQGGRRQ